MLSMLGKKSADDISNFILFPQEIGFHILETICMECQTLIPENKQNTINFVVCRLIVLRFNDTSTLVGHFMSSPREREISDRRDSRRDEREGQGRKRNRNESEETEEIKIFPIYPYLLQG